MSEAFKHIEAERRRQVEVEGWTPAHDDEHGDGELLRAGMIYLHLGAELGPPMDARTGAPVGWPWAGQWFKPKDRRSNLIRAGALFLAEKERIKRAGAGYFGHVDHKLNLAAEKLDALLSNTPTPGDGMGQGPYVHAETDSDKSRDAPPNTPLEGVREAVARIIDPEGFKRRAGYLASSVEWAEKADTFEATEDPRTYPDGQAAVDRIVKAWRQLSEERGQYAAKSTAAAFAKADEILSFLALLPSPDAGVVEALRGARAAMIEAAARKHYDRKIVSGARSMGSKAAGYDEGLQDVRDACIAHVTPLIDAALAALTPVQISTVGFERASQAQDQPTAATLAEASDTMQVKPCAMCFGKLKPEEDGGRECESCGAVWAEGT